jgi:methylamine dehydrogenase accessory protein MauD
MPGLFVASYVVLWIVVIVLAVLVVLMYRHFGMMSMGTLEGVQRDGLPVGSMAPTIGGITAEGVDRAWEPKTGKPQLLLFAAPDCEPCATMMPIVNKMARSAAGEKLDFSAVVPGPRPEVVRMTQLYNPPYPVIAEDGSGAFNRFRVRVTPFGFIIGADGRVLAKGLCGDASRLKDLLEAAGLEDLADQVPAPGQPVRLRVPEPTTAGAHPSTGATNGRPSG